MMEHSRTSIPYLASDCFRSRCRFSFFHLFLVILGLVAPRFARGQSSEVPTRPSFEALSHAFEHEPSVQEVQRKALKFHGLDGELDRWTARARWSHVLPQLDGQLALLDRRDIQRRFREDLATDDLDVLWDGGRNDLIDRTQDRLVYTTRVRFDLSGLVFDPIEMRIAREIRAQADARRDLLLSIADIYFDRRERQIQRLVLASDNEASESSKQERGKLELEIHTLTAHLDALTGGWFLKQVRFAPTHHRRSAAVVPTAALPRGASVGILPREAHSVTHTTTTSPEVDHD